jgi:putative mRNA 3-end processing factor
MTKIKVLGAGQEVGRSGFLVKHKESNVLLDYGLKLDPAGTQFPLEPKENVQSIVLSHAHLDHSGMIPANFKHSNPLVYMTAPTLEIANILWEDSLKIARYDGVDPPFSPENIKQAHKRIQLISYKQEAQIAPNINLQMYDAGHILGSALSRLEFDDGKSLLYTGDYNFEETRLHKGADVEFDDINYLMVESTYGDRDHLPREEVEKNFVARIKKTIDRGGSVIIPAFAVGRSQEILDILNEYKVNDVPIYLDGMGQKVANIYLRYPGYYKNPFILRESMGKAKWVRNQNMRKKIVKEQCIIVTTAGMLEGGPAMYYIKKLANDEKNSILLTGFQVDETKGSILLKTGKIEIDGDVYEPKGHVEKFDFSAHIGQKYLLRTISLWNPEKVVCVHGDAKIIETFKQTIEEKLGIKALAPKIGDQIDL